MVKSGDLVKIHYVGRFEDGTVFDSSEGHEPIAFHAGSEEVIPGVSQAVIGMQPGEKKTVSVPPEQGFGIRRPDLEYEVDLSLLPPDVEVGDRLSADVGVDRITVWVKEIRESSAVLDANHPLAGKTLVFDLEVVDIASEAD